MQEQLDDKNSYLEAEHKEEPLLSKEVAAHAAKLSFNNHSQPTSTSARCRRQAPYKKNMAARFGQVRDPAHPAADERAS
eukprot:2081250-Pyramimonas_sp.AAC.1